jgi:hypothetical protein
MVNYLQYLQLAKSLAQSQLRIEGTDLLDNEELISYSVLEIPRYTNDSKSVKICTLYDVWALRTVSREYLMFHS